jgi:hypothetical protein
VTNIGPSIFTRAVRPIIAAVSISSLPRIMPMARGILLNIPLEKALERSPAISGPGVAADATKANIKTMYSFMLYPPDDEPNFNDFTCIIF